MMPASVAAAGLAPNSTESAPPAGEATGTLLSSSRSLDPIVLIAAVPPVITVALDQHALSYDSTTNTAPIAVTATPTSAVAPWQYAFAVRGTIVGSGSSNDSSVTVTLVNNCSITSQSVTVSITDAAGSTAIGAGTLDRSLCPPPPNVPHASDHILAGPTLTENSFIDRLQAVSSPALNEGRAIYRALTAAGVNPAFALGMFHAESHSGTLGYAVTTRNWGNILYYSWEAAYGAVPYSPGHGYTYARYPTWLAGAEAYASLLDRYDGWGYLTVSSASAHWLGTIEGSARQLTYLNNITSVMSILPDDAVPSMVSLTSPARSGANVAMKWTAKDNVGVVGYQVRVRKGTGAWSVPEATTQTDRVVTLTSGVWTVGVRATDAAANWSSWRSATVAVDAEAPTMVNLVTPSVVRSANGVFTASWNASDNVGVSGYQWRLRRNADGSWSGAYGTTARSRDLRLPAGPWYLGVRARDAVGNWSDWRVSRVVVPVDDRSFAFSSRAARLTGSVFYRGTLTISSRAGASMSTTFSGVALYVIGTSGPAYGRMRITIDGISSFVDTGTYRGSRATMTRNRVILFSTGLSAGSHRLTITVAGTTSRPAIAIDALAFAG